MDTIAQESGKLSKEEQQAIEHFLSLRESKQQRILSLAGQYRQACGEDERLEIALVVAEVLFRKNDDLKAEPLEDSPPNDTAKADLKKHREYVGKQIAKQRVKYRLTQEELASRAGLPQSHISRLEHGVHAPSGLTIRKLADALGIDPGLLDPAFEDVDGDE